MRSIFLFLMATLCLISEASPQATPKFRALAFYSETVEQDHVDFAHQAIQFFQAAAKRDQFEFETTTNWDDLNVGNLRRYQLVVWLDDFPHTQAQRAAFEQYMEHGGGWLGFHIAAFNNNGTRWPWLVEFLGGAVFYGNEWPPLPATLTVDDKSHPVMKDIPESFMAPANEWYIWKPSPRLDKDVKVLMTLASSNYPIGLKDVLVGGDIPVVWTNTRYRMLYLNMGHGDKIFTTDVQNRLLENALLWVGTSKAAAK